MVPQTYLWGLANNWIEIAFWYFPWEGWGVKVEINASAQLIELKMDWAVPSPYLTLGFINRKPLLGWAWQWKVIVHMESLNWVLFWNMKISLLYIKLHNLPDYYLQIVNIWNMKYFWHERMEFQSVHHLGVWIATTLVATISIIPPTCFLPVFYLRHVLFS